MGGCPGEYVCVRARARVRGVLKPYSSAVPVTIQWQSVNVSFCSVVKSDVAAFFFSVERNKSNLHCFSICLCVWFFVKEIRLL